ncbi:autophagy-related protein [Dipodascopsis tothii]|uniref:autophagy-related protein n=1 Tax=Dipodascopsis tothii TaxID=44089 RepID=UPI0034CECF79
MFVITLNLVLDRVLLKDILKAIFSTIFFHRLFTCVRPLIPAREILDISYPCADNAALDAEIEAQIAQLIAALDTASPPAGPPGQQHQAARRGGSWFSKVAAAVNADDDDDGDASCWEKWVINLSVVSPRTESERARVKRSMESQVAECVFKIVEIAERRKSHIPPITTAEGDPFAWRLGTIGLETESDETWGRVFKKMLAE